MQLKKVPLKSTNAFNQLFLDYIDGKPELQQFYNSLPNLKNFAQQIALKKFDQEKRQVLTNTLLGQYQHLEVPTIVTANIESLAGSNTYTITTGHQLNIFTGPLYFHYKIITVINACQSLKEQYPKNNFVPCYWMASEDHDFEEINHVSVDGQKFTWESDQQGAVGRFNPSTLQSLVKAVPGENKLFAEAYGTQESLAQAVRYYVNELYGEAGVVVVDGDDKELKSQFASIIEDDIINNSTNRLATEASKAIEDLGYKTQVYPREINFFYLDDQIRSRIVRNGDSFEVLDSNLKFNEDEIRKLITSDPQKFSPNVLLRPIYQEVIMPNLAYVGGPAEVCYWLQLKSSFDHYQIPFPIVMPRNFGLIVNRPVHRKFQKIDIALEELFMDVDALKSKYVKRNTDKELALGDQLKDFGEQFTMIEAQAKRVDITLEPLVNAEFKRLQKSIEKIEKKLLKAEKRNYDTVMRQIEDIKAALFPGGLQERKANYLSFFYDNPNILHQWMTNFDPFDFSFHVLLEDD